MVPSIKAEVVIRIPDLDCSETFKVGQGLLFTFQTLSVVFYINVVIIGNILGLLASANLKTICRQNRFSLTMKLVKAGLSVGRNIDR